MKTTLINLFCFSVVLATPTRRDASDISTDMDEAIQGTIPCASNAVVFGRGTFDTGNLGVWVGPALKEALLNEFEGDVHVQGVNEEDYPADLWGYAVEGGSDSCGDACARIVDDYVDKCPSANIFVSGWSQGGLCAWKCVNRVNEVARKQLKGMATFGDENRLMDDPQPRPDGLNFMPYCIEDNLGPDVLCTETLTSGLKLPTSLEEFKASVVEPLKAVKNVATNPAQTAAALKLSFQLLEGVTGVLKYFLKDVASGNVRRWMVLPPHFKYGNNGMASQAAAWMAQVARD